MKVLKVSARTGRSGSFRFAAASSSSFHTRKCERGLASKTTLCLCCSEEDEATAVAASAATALSPALTASYYNRRGGQGGGQAGLKEALANSGIGGHLSHMPTCGITSGMTIRKSQKAC